MLFCDPPAGPDALPALLKLYFAAASACRAAARLFGLGPLPPSEVGRRRSDQQAESELELSLELCGSLPLPPTDQPQLAGQIAPHILLIDKSKCECGVFTRCTFEQASIYICPAFDILNMTGKIMRDNSLLYRASKPDCDAYHLRCWALSLEPSRSSRRQARSRHLATAAANLYHTPSPSCE